MNMREVKINPKIDIEAEGCMMIIFSIGLVIVLIILAIKHL